VAGNPGFENMISPRQHTLLSFVPLVGIGLLFPFGVEGGLIGLLLTLFALILYFRYYVQDKTLGLILFTGFFLRAFVALVDEQFAILPYAWDDYFTTAVTIKENFLTGYPLFNNIQMSIHIKSYATFSALWYLFLGNYEIVIRLVNAFLGALIIERIFALCRTIKLELNSSYIVAALVAFWPSFILFNSLNMRDTLIVFLSIDMVYRILKLMDQRSVMNLLFFAVEFSVLAVLRIQNTLVYLAVFAAYIFVSKILHYKIGRIFRPLPLLFVGAALILLFKVSGRLDAVFQYISIEMAGRSIGGSAYLVGQSYESWMDVIKFAPIRFIYFSFGPFPWHVKNAFMVISFVESLAFLILFVAAFKYIFQNALQRSNKITFLLIFALIGLATNALIDSNFGTAIRHKMNYIIIFMIFAVPYLQQLRFTIFTAPRQMVEQ
jgi:hypothetical protein